VVEGGLGYLESARWHDGAEDFEWLFGISSGTADPASPANASGRTRVPLPQSVVPHGTPGVLDGQ
jgi:hypothetical protein